MPRYGERGTIATNEQSGWSELMAQFPGLIRGAYSGMLGLPGDIEAAINANNPYLNPSLQTLPTTESVAAPLRIEGLLAKTPEEYKYTETVGTVLAPDPFGVMGDAGRIAALGAVGAAGITGMRAGRKIAEAADLAPVLKKIDTKLPWDGYRKASIEDARTLAKSGAHLDIKDGKYAGAPDWVRTPEDLQRMREGFDAQVEAGIAGGDWYHRAKAGTREITGGDPNRADIASDEFALWSAQSDPDVNLGFALSGHNAYEAGQPLDLVRTGSQAGKYRRARDTNTRVRQGAKTGQYWQDINPNIGFGHTGTNDIWHGRAFGYVETNPDGSTKPWNKGFTSTQHRFLDGETLLAVERANKKKLLGRDDWTAPEIQAAAWVNAKGNDLYRRGRFPTLERSIAEAAKTYPEYMDRHTANATYELIPGAGTGQMDLANDTLENRRAFSFDPRQSWQTPTGNDAIYQTLGMYDRKTLPATGYFVPQGGLLEINPAFVARPLVDATADAGGRTMSPTSQGLLNAAESLRGYVDMQNMSAFHQNNLKNVNAGVMGDAFIPLDRALSETEMRQVAQAVDEANAKYKEAMGLDPETWDRIGVSDTGKGLSVMKFSIDASDIYEKAQSLFGQRGVKMTDSAGSFNGVTWNLGKNPSAQKLAKHKAFVKELKAKKVNVQKKGTSYRAVVKSANTEMEKILEKGLQADLEAIFGKDVIVPSRRVPDSTGPNASDPIMYQEAAAASEAGKGRMTEQMLSAFDNPNIPAAREKIGRSEQIRDIVANKIQSAIYTAQAARQPLRQDWLNAMQIIRDSSGRNFLNALRTAMANGVPLPAVVLTAAGTGGLLGSEE